ncbi:MAG: hypothetical protein AAF711_03960 [Planctomycetota bacterium]
MCFWRVILVCLVGLAGAWSAGAHPLDEFPQVTVQVSIDDERVRLLSRVPARYLSLELFPDQTPIDLDRIEPVELAKKWQPLLAERCPLSIDGAVVPPVVVKAEMLMEGTRLPVRSFSLPQALNRGYLIFMAEYGTKGKPRRVDLDWTLFANDYDTVDDPVHMEDDLSLVAMVLGYGREEFSVLTPIEPRMTWHSGEAFALPAELLAADPVARKFITLPALSIGIWLAGGLVGVVLFRWRRKPARYLMVVAAVVGVMVLSFGRVTIDRTPQVAALEDDEAVAVFESLHRNIYRAFDYTDEGAVYDALAESVDGPMLEAIYTDIYQSLILLDQNGAVSKAVRVEIEEAVVEPADAETESAYGASAYVVACTWQVDGVVRHFGHSHARTNRFKAVYTVAPRAQGWRIVEAEILQQRRLDDGLQTAEDLVNDS